MILSKTEELIIRILERGDKHLIVKWLSDDKVLNYYEGRNNPYDEDMVEEKFCNGNTDETRCIIEYSRIAIGYIQFYPVSKKEFEAYGCGNFQGAIFGMDQFIGETKYWGQGIGEMLMKSMINFLIKKKMHRKLY